MKSSRDWTHWVLIFVFLILLVGRNIFNKPMLALLLFLYLPLVLANFRQSIILLMRPLSLYALWILFACSYFWTVVPKVSLDIILTQSAFIILAFFIALQHKAEGFVKPLRAAVIVHLIVVLLYCLAFPRASMSSGGLIAFYPQKNGLGVMLALDALVLFYATGRNKLHIALGLLAIGLLIATYSKTSIYLVVVCSLLLPLASWWAKNFYLRHEKFSIRNAVRSVLLALVLIGLVCLVIYRDEFMDMLWLNLAKDTLTGRGTLWLAVIQQVRVNSLLGIGPGSFWLAGNASEIAQTTLYRYDPYWVQHMVSSDGSYIDIIAAVGVLGLVFFLLTVVDLYRRLFKNWQYDDSKLIFLLTTFVILHAVTESTILYSTNILWLIYLLCYLRVFFYAGLQSDKTLQEKVGNNVSNI